MKKNSGVRLDRFLMDRYRRRSREQLKRAIDVGAITVTRVGNKHIPLGRMKASFSLQDGDIVNVLSKRRYEPPVNFDYDILFEDDDILVVNKPANLPVHPAGRFFFHTLLVHLKTRGFQNSLESERTLFLVHRIDRETSGVLLLAKTKEACASLTAQFKERETDKYYLAVVRGEPKETRFDVSSALGRKAGSRVGLKMYAIPENEGGLNALTRFEKVETRTGHEGTFTLLACFPRTGRQHQIRVHADLAGHTLVGDKIYGLSDDEVIALLDHRAEDSEGSASPDPVENEFESDMSEFSSGDSFDEDEETTPLTKPRSARIGPAHHEDNPFNKTAYFEIPGPTATHYAEVEARLLLPRHALHAAGLRFKHPSTGQLMAFESTLPPDLKAFFEGLTHAPLNPFNVWTKTKSS